MRFCSIKQENLEQAAILTASGIVPIATLNAQTGHRYPTDLLRIIESGVAAEIGATAAAHGDALPGLPESAVQFAPPYRTPHKLWGMGLNYKAHADDLAVAQPDEGPGSYMRPNSCIIGPGDPIALPAMSQRVTGEAELALIVSRTCKNLSYEEAKTAIFGYTTALDMTAEDMIRRNARFISKAKGFDTFASLGPWVVTTDELGDLSAIKISTIINGRVHATNVVANMRFDPYWLLSYLSSDMTLEAGDVLCTGTPGAAVLADGDQIEAEVVGVGRLWNPVRKA